MDTRSRSDTELEAGTATIATLTAVTRHADAKVAMLGALYGAVLAIVATRIDLAGWAEDDGGSLTVLCAIGLLLGLLGEGYYLLQAIRPRVCRMAGVNRFSLSTTTSGRRTGWSDRRAAVEAWCLTEALSDLAVRKFRYIRRAVWWTAGYVFWLLALLVVRVVQVS